MSSRKVKGGAFIFRSFAVALVDIKVSEPAPRLGGPWRARPAPRTPRGRGHPRPLPLRCGRVSPPAWDSDHRQSRWRGIAGADTRPTPRVSRGPHGKANRAPWSNSQAAKSPARSQRDPSTFSSTSFSGEGPFLANTANIGIRRKLVNATFGRTPSNRRGRPMAALEL